MSIKPIRNASGFAIFIAFLVGFSSSGPEGCTGSQEPLSERNDGFTDPYLIGRWDEPSYVNEHLSTTGDLCLEVSLRNDSDLSFVFHDDCAAWDDGYLIDYFTGYTTSIGPRKYINLLPDWSRVDENTRAEFEELICPYYIVQYSTFLRRDIAERWMIRDEQDRRAAETRTTEPDESVLIVTIEPVEAEEVLEEVQRILSEAEDNSGQLLFYSQIDDDFLSSEFEAGRLKICEECPCISFDQATLRDFVQKNDEHLFKEWRWLVRDTK